MVISLSCISYSSRITAFAGQTELVVLEKEMVIARMDIDVQVPIYQLTSNWGVRNENGGFMDCAFRNFVKVFISSTIEMFRINKGFTICIQVLIAGYIFFSNLQIRYKIEIVNVFIRWCLYRSFPETNAWAFNAQLVNSVCIWEWNCLKLTVGASCSAFLKIFEECSLRWQQKQYNWLLQPDLNN